MAVVFTERNCCHHRALFEMAAGSGVTGQQSLIGGQHRELMFPVNLTLAEIQLSLAPGLEDQPDAR
jgi:hypothetical protein